MKAKIPTVVCEKCGEVEQFKGKYKKLAGSWGKVALIECDCKREEVG